MRILMVNRTPWDRRLGAARVQIELGEVFAARGHVVEKLSAEDVFPRPAGSSARALLRPDFSIAARPHLRRLGPQFDVIDAQHGDIPHPKAAIGFPGLLVARSCGLFAHYEQAERLLRARWPQESAGHPLARPLRARARRRYFAAQRRSLLCADVANVLSDDEGEWLDRMGIGDKTVVLPNGAYARYLADLGSVRATGRTVAFVGSWTLRKGIRDLADVVRRLQTSLHGVAWRFLGTGVPEATVRRQLGDAVADVPMQVVPSFEQDELPRLLDGVSAGVLPSYVEGFPLTVLELAAAGIPTFAYDVPGPRVLMRQLDGDQLAPLGDTAGLAERIRQFLASPEDLRNAVNGRLKAVAAQYSWERIADEHLEHYAAALERIRR